MDSQLRTCTLSLEGDFKDAKAAEIHAGVQASSGGNDRGPRPQRFGGSAGPRCWRQLAPQQLEAECDQAFPGNGKLGPEPKELRRLREEVRQLKMERDILKKLRQASLGEEDVS